MEWIGLRSTAIAVPSKHPGEGARLHVIHQDIATTLALWKSMTED